MLKSSSRIIARTRPRVSSSPPSPQQHAALSPHVMYSFLSTVTASVASGNRLVISRRAWKAHEAKLPKIPKIKAEKPEDKPWPRNLQIAAYVSAAIFIPYTTIWLITSNPALRDVFGQYMPLDKFRTHFGHIEWGAQSYADEMEDKEKTLDPGYYQYPLEDSYKQRQQEARVEEGNAEDITAHIVLLGDAQIQETKVIPGSTPATASAIAPMVGAQVKSTKIAVGFEDPVSGAEDMSEENSFSAPSAVATFEESLSPPNTRELIKETQTYSNWYYHYVPAADGSDDVSSPQRMSDAEIDIMRMEYTVQELEKQLKDPTCTRDIDELRAELKQTKADLSRLQWKRRFGF